MAAPIRRTVGAVAVAAPVVMGINFGDLGMYAGGQFVPDGDYVMSALDVMMWSGKDGSRKARLGVMITFLPLDTPTEEHKLVQFYSLGGKADQSFAPNAETGKGIIAVPGAPATTLNDKTNWFMFLKSLMDSGLPAGIFSNDTTVLEGTWVHIQNVDEPEERASFQSNTTADVQQQGPRQPQKIAIVTEIKEGGAPWEGGGGIPEVAATPAPKAKTNGVAKPTIVKPAAKPPVAVAAPVVAENEGDEDVKTAAINGVADVISKKPMGCPLAALRTDTFKSVKSAAGEEMAAAVISSFFEGNEEALATLLGDLGYATVKQGTVTFVKPQ